MTRSGRWAKGRRSCWEGPASGGRAGDSELAELGGEVAGRAGGDAAGAA